MSRPRNRKASSLEREVIVAVVVLYALICTVMLAIHYLQPAERATRSSSTSPAHEAVR